MRSPVLNLPLISDQLKLLRAHRAVDILYWRVDDLTPLDQACALWTETCARSDQSGVSRYPVCHLLEGSKIERFGSGEADNMAYYLKTRTLVNSIPHFVSCAAACRAARLTTTSANA